MKDQIDYIKSRVNKFGNISIHTGKLTKKQELELTKHFKIKKEPFGYTHFSCL